MTRDEGKSQSAYEDRVLHEVDGIKEFDNHLPNWWLATLYGAIVFAGFYWFYFHVFAIGESPETAYRNEMAAMAEAQGKDVPLSNEALVDLTTDLRVVTEGSEIFASTCAACHGPAGGGNVGPNLTDEYWMHGGAPEEIYKSVLNGYVAKGMPAWGAQLGPRRVRTVTAYVLTLRNSHAPGGKPAQGEKYTLR